MSVHGWLAALAVAFRAQAATQPRYVAGREFREKFKTLHILDRPSSEAVAVKEIREPELSRFFFDADDAMKSDYYIIFHIRDGESPDAARINCCFLLLHVLRQSHAETTT